MSSFDAGAVEAMEKIALLSALADMGFSEDELEKLAKFSSKAIADFLRQGKKITKKMRSNLGITRTDMLKGRLRRGGEDVVEKVKTKVTRPGKEDSRVMKMFHSMGKSKTQVARERAGTAVGRRSRFGKKRAPTRPPQAQSFTNFPKSWGIPAKGVHPSLVRS